METMEKLFIWDDGEPDVGYFGTGFTLEIPSNLDKEELDEFKNRILEIYNEFCDSDFHIATIKELEADAEFERKLDKEKTMKTIELIEMTTRISPKHLQDFVNFQELINEINFQEMENFELGKDLIVIENHRAGYGEPAFQKIKIHHSLKQYLEDYNII